MDGLTDGWIDWWTNWQMDGLIRWMDWLMDELTDGWINWWMDWRMHWLWIDWWMDWLMDRLTDWWIGSWMNWRMDGLTDGWIDECIGYGLTDGCMDIFMRLDGSIIHRMMYGLTDGYMDILTDGWMEGLIDGMLDGLIDGWTDVLLCCRWNVAGFGRVSKKNPWISGIAACTADYIVRLLRMRKQSGKDVVSAKWNGGVESSTAVRVYTECYSIHIVGWWCRCLRRWRLSLLTVYSDRMIYSITRLNSYVLSNDVLPLTVCELEFGGSNAP